MFELPNNSNEQEFIFDNEFNAYYNLSNSWTRKKDLLEIDKVITPTPILAYLEFNKVLTEVLQDHVSRILHEKFIDYATKGDFAIAGARRIFPKFDVEFREKLFSDRTNTIGEYFSFLNRIAIYPNESMPKYEGIQALFHELVHWQHHAMVGGEKVTGHCNTFSTFFKKSLQSYYNLTIDVEPENIAYELLLPIFQRSIEIGKVSLEAAKFYMWEYLYVLPFFKERYGTNW